MEGTEKQKVNLTTGQCLTIGAGAVLTAAAVVGGVALGRKLYQKARDEEWGARLCEKAGDMRESLSEMIGDFDTDKLMSKREKKRIAKKVAKRAAERAEEEEAEEE